MVHKHVSDFDATRRKNTLEMYQMTQKIKKYKRVRDLRAVPNHLSGNFCRHCYILLFFT